MSVFSGVSEVPAEFPGEDEKALWVVSAEVTSPAWVELEEEEEVVSLMGEADVGPTTMMPPPPSEVPVTVVAVVPSEVPVASVEVSDPDAPDASVVCAAPPAVVEEFAVED